MWNVKLKRDDEKSRDEMFAPGINIHKPTDTLTRVSYTSQHKVMCTLTLIMRAATCIYSCSLQHAQTYCLLSLVSGAIPLLSGS